MGGLARGGSGPVISWIGVGLGIEIIGLAVHDLDGLAHVFAILCWILAAFLANFYRDPDRPIPKDAGVLVSPADGHIMFVVRERATGRRPTAEEAKRNLVSDPLTGDWHPSPCKPATDFETEQRWEAVPAGKERDTDVWRIAVFMSPFDVHVNRAPLAAKIARMEHRTGKGLRRGPFVQAFRKESEYNERVRTVFHAKGEGGHIEGTPIEVTQISGLLARTIAPWSFEGDMMRRGERYGMIKLGSRVDVRAPVTLYEPRVIGADAAKTEFPKGQFVQAGQHVLFGPLGGAEDE